MRMQFVICKPALRGNAVFFFSGSVGESLIPSSLFFGMLQTLLNGVRLAGSKMWIFSANSFNLSKKKGW